MTTKIEKLDSKVALLRLALGQLHTIVDNSRPAALRWRIASLARSSRLTN